MSTHQTEEWQSCTQIHYSWYNTEFSSLQDKEPPPRYYQCKENTHILNKGIALQHLLGLTVPNTITSNRIPYALIKVLVSSPLGVLKYLVNLKAKLNYFSFVRSIKLFISLFKKKVSPEVVSRGHISDWVFVVQPAEAVHGVTLSCPPIQVTAPVNGDTNDTTL